MSLRPGIAANPHVSPWTLSIKVVLCSSWLPTCPLHPPVSLQLRSAGAQALQEQLGAVTCVGSLDLSDNGEWALPFLGPEPGAVHGAARS